MSFTRITAAFSLSTVLLGMGACSTAPTHTALASAHQGGQLPPLLPVRRFVPNIEAMGGYQLSPNGERLMWQQAVGLDVGLAVRDLSGSAAVTTFATGNMGRRGGNQYWLSDSRHIVYTKDPIGDENTRLLVQDTQAGTLAPWTVIAVPGARTVFMGRGAEGSAKFFVASNQRDRTTLDLYEADAQTRSVREVARSDGTILGWLMGADRQLAGRVRQLGREDGADAVVELLQADGQWRVLKTVGGFDSYWVSRIDLAAGKAWVLSSMGRDKTALLEVDLDTGNERALASHDTVDLSFAVLPAGRGGPLGYVVEPGHPEMVWLDTAWQG
ncbi:MAG: hypothetical protein H7238_12305, partial [Polaromonas sp.]|nr:hypothetical protein [Polaromonas sp.]